MSSRTQSVWVAYNSRRRFRPDAGLSFGGYPAGFDWTSHYTKLGLVFPSEPINGAVWGVWSLLFAIAISIISKRFTLIQTALLSWFVGFVFMWVVIGNLGVLPYGSLVFAIPLSLLESFLADFHKHIEM